jgi:tetratricopeptide (TPR) repeat protein
MIAFFLERLAVRCFVAGDYDRAARYFESVQKRDPHRAGLNHNIGLVRMAQRRYDEAEKCFLDDLERYGDSYKRLRVTADLYYVWGNREKAKHYYERALEECEREPEQRLLQQRIQNCADEVAFERVTESHRLYTRGNEAMQSNDYQSAREYYQKSVDCDPTNYQALNNLGAVWMNYERQPERAVEYFERAAELSNLGSVGANLQKARKRAGID